MQLSKIMRAGIAAVILAGTLGATAQAGGPGLAALARLEPGQWELKPLVGGKGRSLCVSDASVLVQYGHRGGQCQRSIVVNDADTATIHYNCPGVGHGTTTFKVATPRSFNLETQGILNGAPFEEAYEARRLGACAATH